MSHRRRRARFGAHASGFAPCSLRYNNYTLERKVRFKFDKAKSQRLRATRGVGFEEAQELFHSRYYLDQLLGDPLQWVAVGWVKSRLYTVVFEERRDREGDYYHLVTLWKSTKAEREIYEEDT